MKPIIFLAVAGFVAVSIAQAQNSPAVQAQASEQTQTNAEAGTNVNRSSAQTNANTADSSQANASAKAGRQQMAISDGTTMNAVLSNSLDAKKNKPGDRVVARTTQSVKENGKTVLPKGTRLIGHITQAQTKGSGSAQSALGVAFDRALLRDGREIPLHATIQALAESQSAAEASMGNADMAAADMGAGAMGSARGGAGLLGGSVGAVTGTAGNVAGGIGNATGAVGNTVNVAAHSAGAVGGLNAAGALNSNSRGVFGLQGLSLDSAASNASEGSLIVSSTRNIHLASGTQMLLRASAQKR